MLEMDGSAIVGMIQDLMIQHLVSINYSRL